MRSGAAAFFVATLVLAAGAGTGAGAQGNPPRAPVLSSFAQEKARALLRDKLSCLGCHYADGQGGIIGPDLSRGSTRSAGQILRMMRAPRQTAPAGTMPAIVLRDEVALLIATYLAALDTPPGPAGGDTLRARLPRGPPGGSGAQLYAQLCSACHGDTGNGDGPNARFLPVPPARHASAAVMSTRTDDRLYDAIAAGGAPLGRSPRMPPFGASLDDAQIRALVAHIRTLCQCTGPAWSRDGARP